MIAPLWQFKDFEWQLKVLVCGAKIVIRVFIINGSPGCVEASELVFQTPTAIISSN